MIRTVATFVFLTSIAVGVQAAEPPAFEVASIRTTEPGRQSIETSPGSVTMRAVRLGACVQWAYKLTDYQVSGPAWLNDVAFDIVAKASTPASEDELRQMMQKLLEERFQLATHRMKKEMPALILTVGKNGHKLQETDKEGSPSFSTGKLNLTGRGATVGQLV